MKFVINDCISSCQNNKLFYRQWHQFLAKWQHFHSFDIFLSLAEVEIVKITALTAANDENFVKNDDISVFV